MKGCLIVSGIIFVLLGACLLVPGIIFHDRASLILGIIIIRVPLVVALVLGVRHAIEGKWSIKPAQHLSSARVIVPAVLTSLAMAAVMAALGRYATTGEPWRSICFAAVIPCICAIPPILGKGKGARVATFALALIVAILFTSSLGDLSDPNRITIINGVRSTDAGEHLTTYILIMGMSTLILAGMGIGLATFLKWLYQPRLFTRKADS